MSHHNQSNELHAAVQLLVENGFDSMANAMNILFNEAMKIERTHYLNAQPYQRTDERKSRANGFKDKTVNSREAPSTNCFGSLLRKSPVFWS